MQLAQQTFQEKKHDFKTNNEIKGKGGWKKHVQDQRLNI